MLTTTVEIPPESVIEGFSACLDPALVLRACREQLVKVAGSIRDTWTHARVIEALYHPQRHLRVVYALLADPQTPASRYWPEGQLVYIHAPLRKPMSRRGTAVTIDGVEVEAYCFPNDRRLRELRKFAGRDSAVAAWQEWLAAGGSDVRLDASTLQRLLVRYVPEQKWVIRLRAEGESIGDGARTKHRIGVRCASPDACTELARRHQALSKHLSSTPDGFTVPSVVGLSSDKFLLAVEWLRGDSLVEALRGGNAADVMAGMAERLRRLHLTPVEHLAPVSVADLADRAHAASEDIALASPELAGDARRVASELRIRLAAMDSAPSATIHNDFHWNQVSIKRDRYALFDLERMGIGDALIDVANLATQLRLLPMRSDVEVMTSEAEAWRAAFLDQWVRHSGAATDRVRFACYAALTSLELARGMMRHLRPGWSDLARQCIEVACDELFPAGSEAGH